MVLEEIVKGGWSEKRPFYSLVLGVVVTLLSFVTSYVLFFNSPQFIGISTILFSVVLIVPTINKLFDLEEKYEAKEKFGFFVKHEHLLDFFIYYFIGTFLVFFLISIVNISFVFSIDQLYNLETVSEVRNYPNNPPPPPVVNGNEIASLIKNNLIVFLIAFVLSLFYGSGAFFLIVLNASVFAATLSSVIQSSLPGSGVFTTYGYTLCNLGILFFHMIPEVTSYLFAGIAGGVLSHAIVREKRGSKRFKNILTDSSVLLIAAVVLVIISAFIEIGISKKLYAANVCAEGSFFVIILSGLIMFGILVFEIVRKKKHTRRKAQKKRK